MQSAPYPFNLCRQLRWQSSNFLLVFSPRPAGHKHLITSSTAFTLLEWCSLLRVSPPMCFMFWSSQPFIIIRCQPYTALATHWMGRLASFFRTLSFWWVDNLSELYFTQLNGFLPMSLESNGNWEPGNRGHFSLFPWTVDNKLKPGYA